MKRYVGCGRSRVPDVEEKGFFTRQGSPHHMNLYFRQSPCEFENPVRPLFAPDIADPQHIDIADSDRQRRLDQHSRHATRQSVVARQASAWEALCTRMALA